MKDNVGLRAGVLDDQSILDKPIGIEVYVERRPPVSVVSPFDIPPSRSFQPLNQMTAFSFGRRSWHWKESVY